MSKILKELSRKAQVDFILKELERHGWNRSETARALGTTPDNLWHKMRALGMSNKSVSVYGVKKCL